MAYLIESENTDSSSKVALQADDIWLLMAIHIAKFSRRNVNCQRLPVEKDWWVQVLSILLVFTSPRPPKFARLHYFRSL